MTSGLPVTDDDRRRLAAIFPGSSAVGPSASSEPFPGFTGAREIFRGTYTATLRGTNETVVIRILPARHFADPHAQHRYAGNLDRASHLRAIGVAPVFGRGTAADGRRFLARAHITGVPIDVFNRGEAFGFSAPPELPVVLNRFAAAARAVHRAHLAGVLHGGIKPTNVLVDDADHTTVVDFGPNLPAVADLADDVASLGRLLFELLRERPAPPDAALTVIASRATASDPRIAYRSAGALADDVEAYAAGRPTASAARISVDTLGPWFAQNLQRPKWAPAIGSACGLWVGLYVACASTTAIPAALAWVWIFATILIALAAGALVAKVAGVQSWAGAMVAGIVSGLVAGFFAWSAGAGPAINKFISRRVLDGPRRMAEAFPPRPPFAALGPHDVVADHPQDQLIDQFPELAGVPEGERSAMLMAQWQRDAASAGAAGALLSGMAPFGLGIGLTVLGCLAFQAAGAGWGTIFERMLTYCELSLPGQFALFLATKSAIAAAARVPTPAPGLTLGLLALAAGCFGLHRAGLPAPMRAACCLAGLTLLCRLAGMPLPLWSEGPVYVALLILCWNYARSFRAPLFPPAD